MLEIAEASLKAQIRRVSQLRNPAFKGWKARRWGSPAPIAVKWAVLDRYGFKYGNWIETGTYLGETTNFLSHGGGKVFTIEPQPELAARARSRFASAPHVSVIEGLSEEVLESVIERAADGSALSFWLDGHYSAGITHKGPVDTPIREELRIIASKIAELKEVAVLVDDVRCFQPDDENYREYPSRSWLVAWADQCELEWTIEHDIFCAYRSETKSRMD